MTTKAETVVFGPFYRGVNNRLDDYTLGSESEEDHDAVRQAVNVFLTDKGRLKRRQGHSLLESATDAHSLFASDNDVLFAAGTALRRFDPVAGASSALRTDLTAGQPVAYVEVNGETFYSNSVQTGRVLSGADREWGVRPPSGLLNLSTTAGALPTGRYQILATFTNAHGDESGTGLAAGIDVASPQGVSIAAIPQPVSAEVTAINLYCTQPNGDEFYLLASVAVGVTSYQLLVLPMLGRRLATQHLTQLPPGNVLAYTNGVIYSAVGRAVFHTIPLAYGLCNRAKNFLMFPDAVRIMAGVSDGLYVATEARTYFLAGTDPKVMVQREVLPYGAAFGSLARTMRADIWTWYSDKGQVLAGPGGEVKNLQEKELALDPATTGASLHWEVDGMKQIVSLTNAGGFGANASVGDFVEMEVRRKA